MDDVVRFIATKIATTGNCVYAIADVGRCCAIRVVHISNTGAHGTATYFFDTTKGATSQAKTIALAQKLRDLPLSKCDILLYEGQYAAPMHKAVGELLGLCAALFPNIVHVHALPSSLRQKNPEWPAAKAGVKELAMATAQALLAGRLQEAAPIVGLDHARKLDDVADVICYDGAIRALLGEGR